MNKIIGVMGSGKDAYTDLSHPIGKLIAQTGFNLLTGGGGGVMESVSKAFFEFPNRKGLSIGIIRGEVSHISFRESSYQPFYVNNYIDIPIYTHLPFSGEHGTSMMSRNHINILSSDIIIALPGESGTFSELSLALKYKKKVILFLGDNTIEGKSAHYLELQHEKEIQVARNIDSLKEMLPLFLEKTEEVLNESTIQ